MTAGADAVGHDLTELQEGPLYRFVDWPVSAVPNVAAGVYTIWDGPELVYVGMSGRSLTEEHLAEFRLLTKARALRTRLNSHASGRRSGDQFCLYVCDRLVLPTLSPEEIGGIGAGTLSLDKLTRTYIRERLSFRFIEVVSGAEALAVEKSARAGALPAGRPVLNPL